MFDEPSAIAPLSAEARRARTRELRRAAKLGKKHRPEHNAAITAGLRRYHASLPQGAPRGRFKELTDKQRADYKVLTQLGHFRPDEAMAMIGRPDLVRRTQR